MADKLEIEVTIGPDGELTLVTHGLTGEACLAETATLEKALGKVLRREKTGEFWKQATGAHTQVKRGR